MGVARTLSGKQNNVIAVIGDGAMSAGMAYEAMNNAGSMDSRLIVVLNDNDMSIAPPVGAMSAYLSRLLSSKSHRRRHGAGGDSVRGTGLFLRRSHRRPQSGSPAARAAQRTRQLRRSGAGPC